MGQRITSETGSSREENLPPGRLLSPDSSFEKMARAPSNWVPNNGISYQRAVAEEQIVVARLQKDVLCPTRLSHGRSRTHADRRKSATFVENELGGKSVQPKETCRACQTVQTLSPTLR
jgi:hypothetical protein